jgi:hypothetical protein
VASPLTKQPDAEIVVEFEVAKGAMWKLPFPQSKITNGNRVAVAVFL